MALPDPLPSLVGDAGAVMDEAVATRRLVHADPEIGLELPHTQELVGDRLAALGLAGVRGRGCDSVVAVIEGEVDGPTTLLRADMDALPMPEDTGLDFASSVPGRMHACGHDAHTAMLLGAARVLQGHRRDLAGRVVLMFQPGEEGHDGARVMIDDGLLVRYGTIDRAFALHITPAMPTGTLTTRPGTIMASADEFEITVTGQGGHASMPHDAVDPLPAAAQIVTGVQAMVTRTISVFDPAVVTISMIHGGTATNVIPESVVLGGTVRAVSDASRGLAIEGLSRLAASIAGAHRCHASLEILPGSYPITINNPAFAHHTLSVATGLVGSSAAFPMPTPMMGAEDWSNVLAQVRGSLAFLGAAPPGVARPAPSHSNHFVIDEAAMATGIAMYTAMALTPSPEDPIS